MPKVSISKTMEDIVSINNQLAGLNMLLAQKKATMAKYFDKSGERSIANQHATVYVQERTEIEYDIPLLTEKLHKEVLSQFIDQTHTIRDWSAFVAFCKANGISSAQLKPHINVKKQVNQKKLTKLYERGVVSLSDIKGCYTATIKKAVVLRAKYAEQEIPLSDGS